MDHESKNSTMMCPSSTADYEWVAQNVQDIDQSVDHMLKIIQEVEGSAAEEADSNDQERSQLIALIKGINQKNQSLAARCDLLIEVLHGNVSATTQLQNFGQESPLLSPCKKEGVPKFGGETFSFDSPPSSGSSGSSFEVSEKAGSGFSSLLSTDSDTESFDLSEEKHADSKHVNYGEVLKRETKVSGNKQKLSVSKDKHSDVTYKVKDDAEISNIVSKIVEYEQEISRLNNRLTTKTSVGIESGDHMLNVDFEAKSRKISELQMQDTFDSNNGRDELMKELEITKEKFKASEDEVARLKTSISNEISQSTCQLQYQLDIYEKEMSLLKANLDSEKRWASEQQDKITGYKEDASDCECEARKLTTALQDALNNSEREKEQLMSHNATLSTNMTLLEVRCTESEVKIKSLETEVKHCKVLNAEMGDLHQAQEMQWHNITECLKAELNEKSIMLEALNKNFDGLKLKFDMLMAEKDGLNAKLQTLHAELCFKDNKIQQAESQLHQLQLQNAELNASCGNALKQRDEFRLKVEELEKELKGQTVVISDRAEEKREAIRQLCFSLEHYRSGYQELRKVYTGQRGRAVPAS